MYIDIDVHSTHKDTHIDTDVHYTHKDMHIDMDAYYTLESRCAGPMLFVGCLISWQHPSVSPSPTRRQLLRKQT